MKKIAPIVLVPRPRPRARSFREAACNKPRIHPGKNTLIRIVSILTKLVAKFENLDGLREESPDYQVSDETT